MRRNVAGLRWRLGISRLCTDLSLVLESGVSGGGLELRRKSGSGTHPSWISRLRSAARTLPLGREARSVLGASVRGLWVRARLTDEIVRAARVLKSVDGWPDGWLGTRRILQLDKGALSTDSLTQLLLDDVDLPDTGNGRSADAASRFRASEKAAENLGKAAAHEDNLFVEILPDLIRTGTNSSWSGVVPRRRAL